jgi:hypothetical protein
MLMPHAVTLVCQNIPSSLTTGPRFVETPAMTTLGGYVTGKRGQVCVVPKLSRVIAFVQNPAPQGEKVAHWLKGGEWDAYFYDYFPAITSCTSWCSLL